MPEAMIWITFSATVKIDVYVSVSNDTVRLIGKGRRSKLGFISVVS